MVFIHLGSSHWVTWIVKERDQYFVKCEMFSVIEIPNRWPLPKATFSLANVAHLYDLAVLVYVCCIINHHMFTGLKQYSLTSSQLFYVASPTWQD